MVWAAVAKGVMGAKKVASGAKMAKNIFKRKGGKDAPDVPASEQTIDVKAETVQTVQPTTPLVPTIGPVDATSISKPTSPTGTEDLEGTAFRIKTTLVDVDTLLRGSFALDKIREEERKKKEGKKERKDQEKDLEKGTKEQSNKFGLGKLVPAKAKGIFGNIINFFVTLLLGKILMGLLNNMGMFTKLLTALGAVANFLVEWGGKFVNVFVSLVDFGYNMVEGLRDKVGDIFGEKGVQIFDRFGNIFKFLVNTALIAAMVGPTIAKAIKAFKAAKLAASGVKAAAVATKGTALAAKGASIGGATAGAIVAGVGLLASGLGEGAFQLTKIGDGFVDYWRKSYKEKKWFDPRKAIDFGIFKIMQVLNLGLGNLGQLLDIIGAPFRYLIELIRYPFLDEAGKAKQRENLAKFDARIREQFRKTLNFFTLGLAFKEEGSFGSLYGEEGTGGMDYEASAKVTNKKADDVLSKIDSQEKPVQELKGGGRVRAHKNTNRYKGIADYASYEGGETITYIVSQKGSSSGGGETSSATNAETVKLSEGLMLSNAGGGDSNNPYDVLAKR